MSSDLVQVKATIPRERKRRAFAALAEREQKFRNWLEIHLETWLQQITAERMVHGQMDEQGKSALTHKPEATAPFQLTSGAVSIEEHA